MTVLNDVTGTRRPGHACSRLAMVAPGQFERLWRGARSAVPLNRFLTHRQKQVPVPRDPVHRQCSPEVRARRWPAVHGPPTSPYSAKRSCLSRAQSTMGHCSPRSCREPVTRLRVDTASRAASGGENEWSRAKDWRLLDLDCVSSAVHAMAVIEAVGQVCSWPFVVRTPGTPTAGTCHESSDEQHESEHDSTPPGSRHAAPPQSVCVDAVHVARSFETDRQIGRAGSASELLVVLDLRQFGVSVRCPVRYALKA